MTDFSITNVKAWGQFTELLPWDRFPVALIKGILRHILRPPQRTFFV